MYLIDSIKMKNGEKVVFGPWGKKYSTVVKTRQNENIIKDFIKSNTNFVIEEIECLPNSFFNKYIKENKYICVQPNKITDGFFICKLCKKF